MDLEEVAHGAPEEIDVHEPILPVEPDEHEPAREGDRHTREDHERCGHGAELEIEDQEDGQQHQRYHHHQALLGPERVLVAAREPVAHPGRDLQGTIVDAVLDGSLCIEHDVHLRLALALVEEHVADEEGVLAADHLGTTLILHVRQFAEGHLHTGRRRHQHAPQLVRVVAQLPRITDPHRIALPALHGGGDGHATDGGLQGALQVLDGEPIARDGLAVPPHLQVGLAHDPVGEHGLGLHRRDLLQHTLQLPAEPLDGGQVRTEHLDAHGRAHAGLQHHQPGLDRLQLGCGSDPGKRSGRDHLGPDVIGASDVRAPVAEIAAPPGRHQQVPIEPGH